MNQNSDISLSVRDLTLCMMGHSAFQYLYAGLELGLFEILHKNPGLSRQDIAQALKLEALPSRCLLLGLTALNFIRHYDEIYNNSQFINEIIENNKLDLLIKVSRFQAKIVYLGQVDFLESLQTNQNSGLDRFAGTENELYSRIASDPSLHSVFFDYMSAWSEESLPLLLETVDFKDCQVIADVGGGDATIAVALAEAYPHLSVKSLDIQAALSLAQARIAANQLTERIQALNCNVFEDKFPPDCDCFLYAHFLVIWSPEENIRLLKKTYNSLPKRGKIIIFNSMASDNEDGPLFAALDCAYFMAIPSRGGLIYSGKDYENWLKIAGFNEIYRLACKSWWTPHGIIMAIKD